MTPPDDRVRSEAITALTRVGMLLYAGWALFFLWVLDRVRRTGATRFAGAWTQRLEALSFITFPPNAPMLFLAAVSAAAATWLAGPTQSLELAILLRLIRWTANAMVVIAVASSISIMLTDVEAAGERAALAFRLAGALIAVATSYVCLAAGRTAPGG